jgi:hypothetical protein
VPLPSSATPCYDMGRLGMARQGRVWLGRLGKSGPGTPGHVTVGPGLAGLSRLGQASSGQAWFALAGTSGLVSVFHGAARQFRCGGASLRVARLGMVAQGRQGKVCCVSTGFVLVRQARPGTVCRGGTLAWQAGDGTVALVPAAVRLGAERRGRSGSARLATSRQGLAWLVEPGLEAVA